MMRLALAGTDGNYLTSLWYTKSEFVEAAASQLDESIADHGHEFEFIYPDDDQAVRNIEILAELIDSAGVD